MSLLEVLFIGSESGAQLGLQLLLPPSDLFSSHSAAMEDWLPGAPFICTEMTKGHEAKLSGSTGPPKEDM